MLVAGNHQGVGSVREAQPAHIDIACIGERKRRFVIESIPGLDSGDPWRRCEARCAGSGVDGLRGLLRGARAIAADGNAYDYSDSKPNRPTEES